MNRLFRIFLKPLFLVYMKLHEKSFDRLKYLYFNRKSKVLAIVFSAFDSEDSHRSYNYVKSLSRIPIDFLFLSDQWGYRGSYYLFHNGTKVPQDITQQLISQYINKKGGGTRKF